MCGCDHTFWERLVVLSKICNQLEEYFICIWWMVPRLGLFSSIRNRRAPMLNITFMWQKYIKITASWKRKTIQHRSNVDKTQCLYCYMLAEVLEVRFDLYRKISNISGTKFANPIFFPHRFAVVSAQSIETSGLVEHEDVVGAAPTSEW